jgi:acyl carrier protein phosphodiesterase
MNFLAHAYLSFNDPGVLTGNMISDFVKGRKKLDYPLEIQRGITLHRLIDAFTDEHPVTRAAKEPFRPAYRLYSGAFVDVIYDHFLANDTSEFPGDTLAHFSRQTYATLREYSNWQPEPFKAMFPYMQQHDWLYNYRTRPGIGKSLHGVVRRSLYLSESDTAMQLLDTHYQLLQDCYRQFWKDIKLYALEQYTLLKENEGND